MEVYFVDVGLGSCQLILLGGRRAIVIDCGIKSDHIALNLLKHLGIVEIECLITSHSHNDHIGGAISILDHYQDQINHIYVIQDHKFLNSHYWKRIDDLIEKGSLKEKQVKLLVIEEQPKVLWRNGDDTQLKIISPSVVESFQAQQTLNSNATSSVIVLDHLGSRSVFAADSEIPQWKRIHERRDNLKLTCDVLAVPHHGGLIDDSSGDLDWLYDKAISAKFAILSVGTRSNPKHPREEVVAKLVSSGSTVLCTEITHKCHKHPHSLSPGVLKPLTPPGRAYNASLKGFSNAIACAGTVLAKIDTKGVTTIERLSQHQAAVDGLNEMAEGCPMCK